MTIVEITGGMLRAARSLTGMTQQEVADREHGMTDVEMARDILQQESLRDAGVIQRNGET